MNKQALEKIIVSLEGCIRDDCQARLDNYPIDLNNSDLHEVIAGLLCRQATLAIQLLMSPGTWNQHSAPLFHRAMADIHITLAFILKSEPDKRARDYILYGLGQEKLSIAHYKALNARKKDPVIDKLIEAKTAWLESQRNEHLTEVNLGSHTGLNTREMADQSGNMGLYNFNFTPFSAAVHSTWQHVSRFNLETCPDPLHGYHGIGSIPDLENDWYEVWVAIKNLRETFSLVDDFMHSKQPISSWDQLQGLMDNEGKTSAH